jgi:catechol 2,3-dioxygenase-like lactoylglutathione lyase family enzyme
MRWLSLFAVSAAALFGQTAAPNSAGVSIGHIHLMVNDPDAQKKIWVDVVGAEVTHAGSLELLKLPGVFIIAGKARTPVTEGSDGSTVNHIGFLVKNYAAMKAKLTAAGLQFSADNEKNKQVTAIFPEKIRVEFTEDASIPGAIQFHHIHIATTDPEATQAWYVKMFGGDAGKRGNFLAAKFPGGEVDAMKAAEAAAPSKGRSLDHIGFEVKNLQEFCKKLEADGIKFELPYREMPQLGGLKIAFLTDPIGTRIELTEGLSAH